MAGGAQEWQTSRVERVVETNQVHPGPSDTTSSLVNGGRSKKYTILHTEISMNPQWITMNS